MNLKEALSQTATIIKNLETDEANYIHGVYTTELSKLEPISIESEIITDEKIGTAINEIVDILFDEEKERNVAFDLYLIKGEDKWEDDDNDFDDDDFDDYDDEDERDEEMDLEVGEEEYSKPEYWFETKIRIDEISKDTREILYKCLYLENKKEISTKLVNKFSEFFVTRFKEAFKDEFDIAKLLSKKNRFSEEDIEFEFLYDDNDIHLACLKIALNFN